MSKTTEKTFSSYNQEQGKAYAAIRRDYHPSVYETIIDHHTSTGGKLDTVVDVGCGPGTVARTLAAHFAHATGLDPSEGMIAVARSLGAVTHTSEPVRFEISTAEELGDNLHPPVADSSVDLIVAANAAHWFDMAPFWPAAARVLKPGGSVALWTSGRIRAHPSMPNAAAIEATMDETADEYLQPYFEPGNLLTRDGYASLPLPWTLDPPVKGFDQNSFFRKDWTPSEVFFIGDMEIDLDVFEQGMSSGSPVTRWRQAHPDKVGTEHDVVKIMRRKVERLLQEAGMEPGKERFKGYARGTVLIVKKEGQ